MILPPEKLTAKQQQQLEHICQASDELRTAYLLSQEFMTLLQDRQAEALDGWLKRAKESRVSELGSFVNGIRRDYAAVRAAFLLTFSNGVNDGREVIWLYPSAAHAIEKRDFCLIDNPGKGRRRVDFALGGLRAEADKLLQIVLNSLQGDLIREV